MKPCAPEVADQIAEVHRLGPEAVQAACEPPTPQRRLSVLPLHPLLRKREKRWFARQAKPPASWPSGARPGEAAADIPSGRLSTQRSAPLTRVVGLDVGRRRIGLAISDRSRTIARPLTTLTVSPGTDVTRVAREIDRLSREEDGVGAIVVGIPVRLDGSSSDQTAYVASFVDRLRSCTSLPVVVEDERLTSREAESRLALGERDWKKRKNRLDAAAAAVILQDYLDRTRG